MHVSKVFKYYWPHIKKYKISTLIVFLGYGGAVVGSGIFAPLLYKKIFDLISSGNEMSLVAPLLFRTVFLLGVIIVIYNLFYRLADYGMVYSQSRILKDVVDDAFKRVETHSYEFFSSNFTGSIIAKIRRYERAFETIHDQVVFSGWTSSLRLIFGFVVLMYYSAVLGSIFLVWIVLFIGVTSLFVRKRIEKDVLVAEANSNVTGIISDVITNMLNVKMFASHKREYDYFVDATDSEEKKRRGAWYFQNIQFLVQGYFIGFFEFVAMFTAVYLWTQGSISVGTIVLMQIYIIASFDVVWHLSRQFTRVMTAFAEAKEMVDIFERPVAILDPENPTKLVSGDGSIDIIDVSFSYEKGEKVFDSLSLSVNPGEKVGIVGPSGAGKSTLTKLLLRFADVEKGEIMIDGQKITELTQDDLRSKIAYVPQDPILFHRTLKENIIYSKPGATHEEMVEAAKKAHAHDFVMGFPLGYDTYVGERGVKLSGGERQRIAIARAMLKNASILILDEATSSLDSISERHIQDAFGRLMEGRTTIVIAHRLSTIQKMDRIVVIDHGQIVEEGTHDSLISKGGLYYRLWIEQSHGFVGV